MQRDILNAIKQFFYSIQQFKSLKITTKTLSDGNIFMQFLSTINHNYFDSGQLIKILEKDNKQIYTLNGGHQNYILDRSFGNNIVNESIKSSPRKKQNKEDFFVKVKNWKIVIKSLKAYFNKEHQKGIKYGDIDLIQLSKNDSIEQISKFFQLILCVIVNCKQKQEYIQMIMNLKQSTQQILANLIQNSLQNRLCSIQTLQRNELIQQLQSKQQQNSSLYQEIQKLQSINTEIQQKLNQFQKISETIQYQKQRILSFNKRGQYSYAQKQQLYGSNSLIDKNGNNCDDSTSLFYQKDDIFCQDSLLQSSFNIANQSFCRNNGSNNGQYIIQSLKNKIIRLQQTHSQQLDQLQLKIQQLQQKLKESYHFEQLLNIYQQKYQQALAYVQKVTLYEKQKNKIYQEMIEKDIIIEELKNSIDQLNLNLVQMEQEKIDLQLLVAKKNNQKIKRNSFKPFNKKQSHKFINEPLSSGLLDGALLLRKTQTCQYPLQSRQNKHQRQISAELQAQSRNKNQFNLYPYLQQQQQDNMYIKNQQLQIKLQQLTLNLKRLQRRQKQLSKQNNSLKQKLQNLKSIQTENIKLQNIIIELHTRKNEEIDLLVDCLYQTYNEYDFKFHKLIKNNCYVNNGENAKQNKHQTFNNHFQGMIEFKEITNLSKQNEDKKSSYIGRNLGFRTNSKRNPSLKLQESTEYNNILQVSVQNQFSKVNL